MPNVFRKMCTAFDASSAPCGLMPADSNAKTSPQNMRPRYSASTLRQVLPVHTKRTCRIRLMEVTCGLAFVPVTDVSPRHRRSLKSSAAAHSSPESASASRPAVHRTPSAVARRILGASVRRVDGRQSSIRPTHRPERPTGSSELVRIRVSSFVLRSLEGLSPLVSRGRSLRHRAPTPQALVRPHLPPARSIG